MDNSKQNIGLTTTVSSINTEQQVCNTRDLPPVKGTLVIAAGGVLKHFTEMPAVCLLVDIIGFGRLLEEKAASSIAMESFIFFETCLNTFKPIGFSDDENKEFKKKFMRLSDTIAIWNYTCASAVKTESVKELEVKALSWIIQVSRHLMVKGFLNNYALKGAIAFSKCIHDINDRAIIGSAWAKAAGLEKQQEWAGIVLDQSAVDIMSDDLKKSAQILLTDVPCKKSTVQGWIVDWRHHPDLNEDYITNTFDSIPASKEFNSENRKKDETLKFYRARQDQKHGV